jgi:hypothetical protein
MLRTVAAEVLVVNPAPEYDVSPKTARYQVPALSFLFEPGQLEFAASVLAFREMLSLFVPA